MVERLECLELGGQHLIRRGLAEDQQKVVENLSEPLGEVQSEVESRPGASDNLAEALAVNVIDVLFVDSRRNVAVGSRTNAEQGVYLRGKRRTIISHTKRSDQVAF